MFRRSGALLDGHFRLSSGLHSPVLSAMRARASASARCGSARRRPGCQGPIARRRDRAVTRARRHRDRPGSRPRAPRARDLRRAPGRHADLAARLHAGAGRKGPRRRRRRHDRRLDARDHGGGARGRRGGGRRLRRSSIAAAASRTSACRSTRCCRWWCRRIKRTNVRSAGGRAGRQARVPQHLARATNAENHHRLRRLRVRRVAAAGQCAHHPGGDRRRARRDPRRTPRDRRGRPHRFRGARGGASGERHDRSPDPAGRAVARAQRAAEGGRHPHPRHRRNVRRLRRALLCQDPRRIGMRCGTGPRPTRSSATSCGTCRRRSISIAWSPPPRPWSASTISPRSRGAAAT